MLMLQAAAKLGNSTADETMLKADALNAWAIGSMVYETIATTPFLFDVPAHHQTMNCGLGTSQLQQRMNDYVWPLPAVLK